MDDKEYYSMMNRSNSALIIQQLLKKAKKNNDTKNSHNINLSEGRQGREDTEMLYEKKGGLN